MIKVFCRLTVYHIWGVDDDFDHFFLNSAEIQGESLTVDFPEHKNWTGLVSEMELVTGSCTGNLPMQFFASDCTCKWKCFL